MYLLFLVIFKRNFSIRSQWMVTPPFPLFATRPQSQKTTRVWSVDQKTQISLGLSLRTSSLWRFRVSLTISTKSKVSECIFSSFFWFSSFNGDSLSRYISFIFLLNRMLLIMKCTAPQVGIKKLHWKKEFFVNKTMKQIYKMFQPTLMGNRCFHQTVKLFFPFQTHHSCGSDLVRI